MEDLQKNRILEFFKNYCITEFGKQYNQCNKNQQFEAFAKAIMLYIVPRWKENQIGQKGKRKAFYFSSEYLLGRLMTSNLLNLSELKNAKEILTELQINYGDIEDAEPDQGLGNGGLGRLAACFLDSGATLGLPLNGYGLWYEYGIFKQQFVDGVQVEQIDPWLSAGAPFFIRREEEKIRVDYGDFSIYAVPYDMPVTGFDSGTINTLRLWKSEAIQEFDLAAFNQEKYKRSVRDKLQAENISKILYPNDNGEEGKILRIRQQYLLSSASLKDLVHKHKAIGRDLETFAQYHAIQLNDTHPAVSVPELMRILTKEEHLDWKQAWEITVNTFAYTNHTLLEEALEKWPVKLYKKVLPEIYQVIVQINIYLRKFLKSRNIPKEQFSKYAIIDGKMIKMAYLSIFGSHSVNGVAQLHTDLLINQELRHYYELFPSRFNNKTNGISQRKWLLEANPLLAEMITKLLGNNHWVKDLNQLEKLQGLEQDTEIIREFLEIKQTNKAKLAEYIHRHLNIKVEETSIFDVQIKRLHEYKRQLLMAFYILDLYHRLKKNPELDIVPRTFIFGAKAAPGYLRAKGIIKFIHEIGKKINEDESIGGKIKVIFIENYGVSVAQLLFSGADLSEQISTAGKEASGTGNMKFMLNGTPTIGTLDGANVEIVKEAGEENNFIFGLKINEIDEIKESYDPKVYYNSVKGLKEVMDSLVNGEFSDGGNGIFKEIYDSLLIGASCHKPDEYFISRDFESYREAQALVDIEFRNQMLWGRKSWINMTNAGKFSSDRTLQEYNQEIWNL